MTSSALVAHRFTQLERLSVRQRKRWLEILLSFETRNQYDAYDQNDRAALHVEESDTGFLALLARLFLGPIRPFTCTVQDTDSGETILRLERPFRFIFHRIEVKSGDGTVLGAVEKKWSWIRRIYEITDARGQVIARLFGPVLKPWTFEIQSRENTVGYIRKKWSGFGKELFSDADNFAVDLALVTDPHLRALAFAATVLIDVVHFERSKND